MAVEYNIETCKQLADSFQRCKLFRPMRIGRYDPGTELEYEIKSVSSGNISKIKLLIEKFVGGGFAGQVYKVKVLEIESGNEQFKELKVGNSYAIKILIPPSGFSKFFRNLVYWIGFQGPFQLQVNPAASRAGAIWQKFIRRAAKIRFGTETSVVDIYATFIDHKLGSCGEISQWIEGRTWQLEVNNRMDYLKKWLRGKPVSEEFLGSPEYRHKKIFMREFVKLLHDIGGYEFARQYEWSTWKSQPNCLKRSSTEEFPSKGLTAVDFRAGLALLPFLPMSPGDFRLIITGIARASLVQFDRGNLQQLKQFIRAHPEKFDGMDAALEELKSCERIYRNSVPDVTHNHLRLLYSRRLWSTMLDSAVTGWKVRNFISDSCRRTLKNSTVLTLLFGVLGLVPIAGRFLRRIWGQPFWRAHYRSMLTGTNYLSRALRAKFIEKIIDWHRAGRIDDQKALRLPEQLWRCWAHWMLAWLPAGIHRFLTDASYARQRLEYITLRPVRLYFNNALREQWLRDMLAEGRRNGMISEADAQRIEARIGEPFIQKYLKSLAVHVCTLPVTQVVSVLVSIVYWLRHPEIPPELRSVHVAGILAAFQLTPISPGSLTRGLYVLYLVLRERNFKDYNVAVFLGFFKYVGYLAFPIQMAYRYPALARFMAGHWATGAVHVVPVFGERGALLEHAVFDAFYNYPLTVRRKMRQRAQRRRSLPSRLWHAGPIAAAAVGLMALAEANHIAARGIAPALKDVLLLALPLPLLIGMLTTRWAGGLALTMRVALAAACGALAGALSAIINAALGYRPLDQWLVISPLGYLATSAGTALWWAFAFGLLAVIGALLRETSLSGEDP